MSIYSRAKLSASEKAKVEYTKNDKNQNVDPNNKNVVLQKGKVDLGHKYGYEEKVMQMCAKKCGMSQRDYNKMMKNPDLYQWEDRHLNRSHVNECKNFREQIHNCMKVIREYRNKDNGKNLQPLKERNSAALSKIASHQQSSKGQAHSPHGGKSATSGGGKDASTGGIGAGGKGAASGGGKGASAGGGKGR